MKPLTLLFTSIFLLNAGVVNACDDFLLKSISASEVPDLSHVDDAPRSNQARASVIAEWWDLNCQDFHRIDIVASKQDNLVCRVKGQLPQTIVIGAHYDKVQKGYGVADNWSGIVLLDGLMKNFQGSEPTFTLEFVAFAAEERGMLGSKGYLARKSERPLAMVNLDTLGLGPMIISGESNRDLACLTGAIAKRLNLPDTITTWSNITGDFEPFLKVGVPAIGLHSVNANNIRRIHHRRDRRGNVDLKLLGDAYRITEQLIGFLAEESAPSTKSGFER